VLHTSLTQFAQSTAMVPPEVRIPLSGQRVHILDSGLVCLTTAKDSPLGKALSEHINRLKASGIYFRFLERYLGSKAVEVVKAGKVR